MALSKVETYESRPWHLTAWRFLLRILFLTVQSVQSSFEYKIFIVLYFIWFLYRNPRIPGNSFVASTMIEWFSNRILSLTRVTSFSSNTSSIMDKWKPSYCLQPATFKTDQKASLNPDLCCHNRSRWRSERLLYVGQKEQRKPKVMKTPSFTTRKSSLIVLYIFSAASFEISMQLGVR